MDALVGVSLRCALAAACLALPLPVDARRAAGRLPHPQTRAARVDRRAVLLEVDRLIGDAARHIGSRQTRAAVRGQEEEVTARLLRRLALTVNVFSDAEMGKVPPAQALLAARVLYKAALAYDLEDHPR